MSVPNAPGFGTTLSYGSTDYTGAQVPVTGLVELDPPKRSVAPVQNSNYGTTGQTHTYQPGWRTPGKLKFSINWDHAQVAALDAIVGVMKGWIITINDGTAIGGTTSTTIKVNGFIIDDGVKTPMEKLDTADYDIQTSGPTIITPGT